VRFEVSRTLDAIERRLSTDPALARGVLDLAEVIRYVDLDGGRRGSVLRLGMVVDALSRLLGEENVPVYAVADRKLFSDPDLSSNERMVARRWADDGLVEALTEPEDRVLEVAELIGLPVLSRQFFERWRDRYGWLGTEPGRLLAPVAGHGGAVLVSRVPGKPAASPRPGGPAVLQRVWRCSEPGCGTFGGMRLGRPGGQGPPRLRGGAPVCPRHDTRLSDAGPRPRAEVLAIRVDGVVRQRFVVAADQPVVVGRAPDGPDQAPGALVLGHWLSAEARRWISRSHVRLELRGTELVARDVSTNGTVIRLGGSMEEPDRLVLTRDQARALADDDVIELYPGVQVGIAGTWAEGGVVDPASVMADAPTMSIRVINN
jgi:hypothetical protein